MTDPDLPSAGRRPPSANEEPAVAAPGDDLAPLSGTPGAAEADETITPETVRYVRPAPGAVLTPEPAPPVSTGEEEEETARLDPPPVAEDDLDGPTRRLDRPGGPSGASPERVTPAAGAPGVPDKAAQPPGKRWRWSRPSPAGALIWVLLALFGFTLVVQLRSNDGEQGLATARQEDLVRILSDLEARDSRLQSEISALETSQRQLTSGVAGRQAALAEAEKRADELGLLAGTLPGRGPGLVITMDKIKASAVLNAVQELRGAGGEVMQIAGANGQTVRIVASSYFVDAEGGGIICDGAKITGPYLLTVIGSPQTMQTALQIPGGVVASVNSGGGSVTMEQRAEVEVTAVHQATALQYAKPAS